MCFGSRLIDPHKEFLHPRPPHTHTKYDPLRRRSKFNPHPHEKHFMALSLFQFSAKGIGLLGVFL